MIEIRGKDWEVKRDFIDPYEAREAAIQAVSLLQAAPGYTEEFKPAEQSWDPNGLTVLKVNLEAMPISEVGSYSGLLSVAHAVNGEAQRIAGGEVSSEIFLNIYRPGSSTGEHRDHYTDATVAVGLHGVADAHLFDSERGNWQKPISLNPGDALCLNSEGFVPPEERPVHRLECSPEAYRVAMVNA